MEKLFNMRYLGFVIFCFVIFFSCNNHQEEKDLSIKVDKLEEELKNLKEEEISGTYIGDFGSNLINITLFDCKDGIAKGYSVCAGNDRDISGLYNHIGDGLYEFELDEPGDNKYDGSFKFKLDINTQIIQGDWVPYKDIVKPRSYRLKRKDFQYDINNGNFPYASQRYLTQEELFGFELEELSEMRNEIYARYGYSFKTKHWRHYFEDKDWYIPTRTDIRDQITRIESKNIKLIKDLEEYWDLEYDSYGR